MHLKALILFSRNNDASYNVKLLIHGYILVVLTEAEGILRGHGALSNAKAAFLRFTNKDESYMCCEDASS